MTIQTSTLGNYGATFVENIWQSGEGKVFGVRFTAPACPIRVTSLKMATGAISSGKPVRAEVWEDKGEGTPRGPRRACSATLTVNTTGEQVFTFTGGPWLKPGALYWAALVPLDNNISVNWRCGAALAGYNASRWKSVVALELSKQLPNNRIPLFELAYEYDDAWTPPEDEPAFWEAWGSAAAEIPFSPGDTQQDDLIFINQVAIEVEPGDVIRAYGDLLVTNDTAYAASLVPRIRAEPTSGSNWGDNVDPNQGRDDYHVNGMISPRLGENITTDVHHGQRNIFMFWVVPEGESGTYYIKLCARSSNSANSGNLSIDTAHLAVFKT